MRTFDTGATRDTDGGKLDFEGFLSPLVLERFAQYMHANRVQADGSVRGSDNWQKGIPQSAYVKSAWRHFFAFWKAWRRSPGSDAQIQDACALLFNIMGWLHEELQGRLTWEDDTRKTGSIEIDSSGSVGSAEEYQSRTPSIVFDTGHTD